MIEHPLPQNITAYQFHLIGNMTVKQFLMLLVGVGIGFLFYQTNLPMVIKWFFILFFFLLAAATAFLPYESRTLDQWLVNFIRAIYRPTKFYWTRKLEIPAFFGYIPRSDTQSQDPSLDLAPYKRQQVRQYLSSLGTTAVVADDPLDLFTQRSSQINDLFTNVQAAADVNPAEYEQIIKPQLQVRARPLRPQRIIASSTAEATPVRQVAAPNQHSTAVQPEALSPVLEASASAQTTASQTVRMTPKEVLRVAPSQQAARESDTAALGSLAPESQGDAQMYSSAAQGGSSQAGNEILPAVFSNDLPFPSVPDKPNLLVGMVHDPEHKILSGAIVEILDTSGNTVRAMKTNALGQFYISSPLPNGEYRIETEKDGVSFPVYSFAATGNLLAPIDVQARPTPQTAQTIPEAITPLPALA